MLKELDVPPLWLAAFMATTYGLEQAVPTLSAIGLASSYLPMIGVALIGLGVLLAAWSAATFLRRKTPIIPRRDAARLVTEGPYRFSRNPIYVADVLILVGWAGLLQSLWPCAAVVPFMKLIETRFIAGEEAMLARAFPDEFRRWSAKVRRWL